MEAKNINSNNKDFLDNLFSKVVNKPDKSKEQNELSSTIEKDKAPSIISIFQTQQKLKLYDKTIETSKFNPNEISVRFNFYTRKTNKFLGFSSFARYMQR